MRVKGETFAPGRKLPFKLLDFIRRERPLWMKADVQRGTIKIKLPSVCYTPAISMGRRNTRLKPSILVFGPDGFVGAS